MNGFKSIVMDCADLLAGKSAQQQNIVDSEAVKLLKALGYKPEEIGKTGDPEKHENLRMLLSLAARCDDLFTLEMPHAPGAAFVGAKICAQSFDIKANGQKTVGVAGRGETFRQAFESCLGEVAEYLSFIERDNDPISESACQPDDYSPSVTNWIMRGLDLQSAEQISDLEHVKAYSPGLDKVTTFPVELVLRRLEGKRVSGRAAHSNGVAAGKTLPDAVGSGILELIERDAMMLWWHGGNPARTISNGAVWGGDFLNFIGGCREGSSRDCWFLDISSDIPIPVVAAFSSHVDGSSVVGGFAAHPDLRRAARRAFLEMCQMELAQKISVEKQTYLEANQLSAQDRIWIERDKKLSLDNFPRLKKASSLEKMRPGTSVIEGRQLEVALGTAGLEAFFVDLTRPDIGVPTARALIPGLQSTDLAWVSERLLNTAQKNSFEIQEQRDKVSPF